MNCCSLCNFFCCILMFVSVKKRYLYSFLCSQIIIPCFDLSLAQVVLCLWLPYDLHLVSFLNNYTFDRISWHWTVTYAKIGSNHFTIWWLLDSQLPWSNFIIMQSWENMMWPFLSVISVISFSFVVSLVGQISWWLCVRTWKGWKVHWVIICCT